MYLCMCIYEDDKELGNRGEMKGKKGIHLSLYIYVYIDLFLCMDI
jgi:hypothetical protein